MLRLIAGVLAAGAVLVACDPAPDTQSLRPRTPVTTPVGTDTRIIGLVGTMSGPRNQWGQDAFEGAGLAIQELNREVRPGRTPFELVTHDDQGDPGRAAQLVQQLATTDRVRGIVFAGPPEALIRIEPVLAEARIPLILCFGDLYSARLLQAHIFQASPPLLWQSRSIARYLSDDRGYELVGALAARDLSGQTAVASLRSATDEQGLRLAVTRYNDPDDLGRALRRLRQRRVEGIVVQGAADVFADVVERQAQRDHAFVARARARTVSAPGPTRPRRGWHPQLFGFDNAIAPGTVGADAGGVAATDSYARGKHFLPVPRFERFAAAFREWWAGDEPLGWEHRAYDATRMIGWAAQRARADADLAPVLERMNGVRFGGLPITFGPDDHTAVEQTTIGLWVVPAGGSSSPNAELPWLPLARGFSIDGERTAILPEDWRYLFRNPPPPDGPPPRVTRMRYAVNTPASDPIH